MQALAGYQSLEATYSRTLAVLYDPNGKGIVRQAQPNTLDHPDSSTKETFEGIDSLPPSLRDILDTGNSRGLQPGDGTTLMILQEKSTLQIRQAFRNIETAEAPKETEHAEKEDPFTPEKTAKRIVDFALKFYDAFSKAHDGESKDTLDKFLGIVEGAIDEGFSKAKKILGKHFNGEIPDEKKNRISATRDIIGDLLDEFRKSVLERLQSGNKQDESGAGGTEDAVAVSSGTETIGETGVV